MWAISGHEQFNTVELFDKKNKNITEDEFTRQTGLNARNLVDLAIERYETLIKSSKGIYRFTVKEVTALLNSFDGSGRNEYIEKLLKWCKIPELIRTYIKKINKKLDYPKEIVVPVLNFNPACIRYINNPSEYEQLIAVKKDGMVLRFIKTPSAEICRVAVIRNGEALKYVPSNLRNYDFYLSIVSQNGSSLKIVPPNLRNYDLCLASVRQDGVALEFVPPELKDYDMCFTAVSKNGFALSDVPFNMRDYDLCIAAVSQEPRVMLYVPPALQSKVKAHFKS